MTDTIGSVGWPILQAGLSTVMGTVVLALVPSYIVRTFVKAIFLTVTVGIAHALLFLPVFMSSLGTVTN